MRSYLRKRANSLRLAFSGMPLVAAIAMTLLVLGFTTIFFHGLVLLSFSGAFDVKYSSEELTRNFIEHEAEFAELETYIISILPKDREEQISFGISKGGRVDLSIYPTIIDPANTIIGGGDLRIGSPELDSVLVILGWTNETVSILRDKLRKTNCDWIIRRDGTDNIIDLYPYQNGWGWHSYYIFQKPIIDSLDHFYGRQITNSEFGKRVVLSYSSAL